MRFPLKLNPEGQKLSTHEKHMILNHPEIPFSIVGMSETDTSCLGKSKTKMYEENRNAILTHSLNFKVVGN